MVEPMRPNGQIGWRQHINPRRAQWASVHAEKVIRVGDRSPPREPKVNIRCAVWIFDKLEHVSQSSMRRSHLRMALSLSVAIALKAGFANR